MEANNDREREAMKEPAHALLGASSSHRWLECTPSARAEEAYPDESSSFAEEGTLAHALCAMRLKEVLGLPTATELAEVKELSDYLTGEMTEYVRDYRDFVLARYSEARRESATGEVKPKLLIEKRLDYSDWVPGGFGTGDAVILSAGGLEVIDFKYGKGVKVEAENNTQMKLYALGAISEYDYAYPFSRVRMTIYQPRIGNISTWETDGYSLTAWADGELKLLAQMAWRGLGARKSGEWCRFCKAKGDCPRYACDAVAGYLFNPNAEKIDLDTLGTLLKMAGDVKDWVKAIEERGLNDALAGVEIPGFKIVEGRSVRKVTDAENVINRLAEEGYEEDLILKPRELKTLTDLEKLVGKKKFTELCGEWIAKPAGKPTLVPVEDKRKAVDENDFKGIV